MSVRVEGRVNLLSGHYKDIIIDENRQCNFLVKVRLNEKYCVKKLDNLYQHFEYRKLEDLDRIRKIIEYYLNNNTIFMLSSNAKLDDDSEYFQAINAFNRIIDDYQPLPKALYFRIITKGLEDIMFKIIDKYHEDRIRHLDKILESDKIIINIDFDETSYYIANDEAIIKVLAKNIDKDICIYKSDKIFLKELLVEFIKRYGYGDYIDRDFYNMELHDKNHNKSIVFDSILYSYILDAEREVYKMNQYYNNITIDDYLSSLKEDSKSVKKKIKR